jgi:hypothetical protein
MTVPLIPVKIDKNGPAYSIANLTEHLAGEIDSENGTYITRGAKLIMTDYKKATDIMDEGYKTFKTSISNFMDLSNEFRDHAKKVSGDVRKAADDLASGLAKVEKQANFSNLEKYVNLLERAATAMSTLAELEKTGKLEKISGALK